jgi:hypothetical protein
MSAAIANSHRIRSIWVPPSTPPAELAADTTRRTRSGPKPPLTGAALRKAILAICAFAACSGAPSVCSATIPFSTLYTLFARWTRVAAPAQPLDPGLAAGLQRHPRSQRRHHR